MSSKTARKSWQSAICLLFGSRVRISSSTSRNSLTSVRGSSTSENCARSPKQLTPHSLGGPLDTPRHASGGSAPASQRTRAILISAAIDRAHPGDLHVHRHYRTSRHRRILESENRRCPPDHSSTKPGPAFSGFEQHCRKRLLPHDRRTRRQTLLRRSLRRNV